MSILVISNLGPGETFFEGDAGAWNVSRAFRDCLAGKHKLYEFDVPDVYANNKNIEVEEAKIAALVEAGQERLRAPAVIFVVQDGKLWLIDGAHRINALHRLGRPTCRGYVIEEEDAEPYRVHFGEVTEQ